MGNASRKREHIDVCLKKKIEFEEKTTGFEEVELEYDALPEISLKEVDLKTNFLGKDFSAPIMVSAITGGFQGAEKINKDIASACEELGIGFGLGSMRAMIENKKLAKTYKVRGVAKSVFVSGNIGAAQLKKIPLKEIKWALEETGADALAVHLNAAQEAVQAEGTTDFSGCLKAIEETAIGLGKPVYVKETGYGISRETANKLAALSIKAIEASGAGGTSWTKVEAIRAGKKENCFCEFGIPTAVSVMNAKQTGKLVIASGGIRSGLDIAKSIALGAELAGIALPVLKAQDKGGKQGARKYLEKIIEETRIAFFLSGAKNLQELKQKKYYLFGKTLEWVEQLESET